MSAHPYQFVFLGLSDRFWWCKDDTQAERKAKRWAGIYRNRAVDSCPIGSMARSVAEDHLSQGPHIEWRRYQADAAGIISCNPATPWRRLSVGNPHA